MGPVRGEPTLSQPPRGLQRALKTNGDNGVLQGNMAFPRHRRRDMEGDGLGESAASPATADVLIIGGGPTGLFAAYYAGFRGLRTCIVDSLHELGGQVAAL